MSTTGVPSASRAPWATALLSIPLVVWSLGSVMGEGLEQAGLYACLLSILICRRVSVARDVKQYMLAALGLAGWQALSPAVALLTGTAQKWPRGLRYSQVLDTLAPSIVTLATQLAFPLLAMLAVLSVGWALSVWLGAFQHFVEWPFGQPGWTRTPVERLHENFAAPGEPKRFGAGGFLIHRLRFGHGSVSMLGPALAALSQSHRWVRLGGLAMVLHLLSAPVLGFTRAALGVGMLMALTFTLLQVKGRARWVVVLAGVGLVALSMTSESWRQRVVTGLQNINGGERTVAMSAGLELIAAHPLIGVGFGNHQPLSYATHDRTGVTEYLATDSHNLLLTVWAETGLLGVVLLFLMHGLLVRALWARFTQGSVFALAGLLSWVGFQLLCLVHYLPYHSGVHLSFALVWGVGLREVNSRPDGVAQSGGAGPSVALTGA